MSRLQALDSEKIAETKRVSLILAIECILLKRCNFMFWQFYVLANRSSLIGIKSIRRLL